MCSSTTISSCCGPRPLRPSGIPTSTTRSWSWASGPLLTGCSIPSRAAASSHRCGDSSRRSRLQREHSEQHRNRSVPVRNTSDLKRILQSVQSPAAGYWNMLADQTVPQIRKAQRVEAGLPASARQPCGREALSAPGAPAAARAGRRLVPIQARSLVISFLRSASAKTKYIKKESTAYAVRRS